MGCTYLLQENERYVVQQSSGTKVWMSSGGNRGALKLVCWYRVKHVNTVTSLTLKREPEIVRRGLRKPKTGEHENTDGTHGGAMTANEKLTHERSGHATFDLMFETSVRVRGTSRHPRRAVSGAAFFVDHAKVKNSQHKSEVKILVGAGLCGETFARASHRKSVKTLSCF